MAPPGPDHGDAAGSGSGAPLVGLAAGRFGGRVVTSVGMAVATIGLGVGAIVDPSMGLVGLVLAVVGIGLGTFTPANKAIVARAGRDEQAGLGRRAGWWDLYLVQRTQRSVSHQRERRGRGLA